MKPALELSTPQELRLRLRWIALLSSRIPCDYSVTGGVHTAGDAIKAIMAGADTVQLVSCLLRNGPGHLKGVLDEMVGWFEKFDYASLDDACGSMSYRNTPNPEAVERALSPFRGPIKSRRAVLPCREASDSGTVGPSDSQTACPQPGRRDHNSTKQLEGGAIRTADFSPPHRLLSGDKCFHPSDPTDISLLRSVGARSRILDSIKSRADSIVARRCLFFRSPKYQRIVTRYACFCWSGISSFSRTSAQRGNEKSFIMLYTVFFCSPICKRKILSVAKKIAEYARVLLQPVPIKAVNRKMVSPLLFRQNPT